MQEIKARKGRIIAIVTEGDAVSPTLAEDVIILPPADEIVAPMLSTIPLQLFAYHIGVAKAMMLTSRATWPKA